MGHLGRPRVARFVSTLELCVPLRHGDNCVRWRGLILIWHWACFAGNGRATLAPVAVVWRSICKGAATGGYLLADFVIVLFIPVSASLVCETWCWWANSGTLCRILILEFTAPFCIFWSRCCPCLFVLQRLGRGLAARLRRLRVIGHHRCVQIHVVAVSCCCIYPVLLDFRNPNFFCSSPWWFRRPLASCS